MLLGAASGGLIDVDLDAMEAVRLAPYFLPTTKLRHGRPSKRNSHWWYELSPAGIQTQQFTDADKSMLLEVRGNSAQTVVPISVHPSGERITWDAYGEPTKIEQPVLLDAVKRLAAATLMARHWPVKGSRHNVSLALAGTLLGGGATAEVASDFIRAVATAAGDDEVEDRVQSVTTTVAKLDRGEAVTGRPTLAELLDVKVVQKLSDWFGLMDYDTPAGDVAGWNLHDARDEVQRLLTEATDAGDSVIIDALSNPAMLDALAVMSIQSRGEYEAALIQLEGLAKKKHIEALGRAVKAAARDVRQTDIPPKVEPYIETDEGLLWMRPSEGGAVAVRLTNFTCRIDRELTTASRERSTGADPKCRSKPTSARSCRTSNACSSHFITGYQLSTFI